MKHLLVLLAVLCTGCSTVSMKHGKFYITNESLPTITNDRHYNDNEPMSQKILVNGNKIQYQYHYKF